MINNSGIKTDKNLLRVRARKQSLRYSLWISGNGRDDGLEHTAERKETGENTY